MQLNEFTCSFDAVIQRTLKTKLTVGTLLTTQKKFCRTHFASRRRDGYKSTKPEQFYGVGPQSVLFLVVLSDCQTGFEVSPRRQGGRWAPKPPTLHIGKLAQSLAENRRRSHKTLFSTDLRYSESQGIRLVGIRHVRFFYHSGANLTKIFLSRVTLLL